MSSGVRIYGAIIAGAVGALSIGRAVVATADGHVAAGSVFAVAGVLLVVLAWNGTRQRSSRDHDGSVLRDPWARAGLVWLAASVASAFFLVIIIVGRVDAGPVVSVATTVGAVCGFIVGRFYWRTARERRPARGNHGGGDRGSDER